MGLTAAPPGGAPPLPPPVRSLSERGCTPAQARLAAELLSLARGFPAGQGGQVHVPIPQAELSAALGHPRRSGTIYCHIRGLARLGAVTHTPGRSGLTVDPERLAALAGGRPGSHRGHPGGRRPSPPRPARPATSPTALPQPAPAPGATNDTLVAKLTELAARMVTVLEELVALAASGEAAGPTVSNPPVEPASATPDTARDAADLAHHAREESRMVRENVANGARDASRTSRVVSPDRREGESLLPARSFKSLPPSTRVTRDMREGLAHLPSRIAQPDRASPERSDEELDELIAPLTRLIDDARPRHLSPLTNRTSLRDALACYSDDQVRHAVAVIRLKTMNGELKSPIGVLVTHARNADEAYFPARPEPATSHSPTPADTSPLPTAPDQEQPATDAAAAATVAALEATGGPELEELDRWIRGLPWTAKVINVAGIHQVRIGLVKEWQARQAPAAS